MSEVTRILAAIEQGNAQTSEELLPLVYNVVRCPMPRRMISATYHARAIWFVPEITTPLVPLAEDHSLQSDS
jgi:hypothetical protein